MKLIIATVLLVLAVQMNAVPIERQESVEEMNVIREMICVTRLLNTSQLLIRDQVAWFQEVQGRFDSISQMRDQCERVPTSLRENCYSMNDATRQAAILLLLVELRDKARDVPQEIEQVISDFNRCRA